jgi:hypothetical protein
LGFLEACGAGADKVQASLAVTLNELGFFENAEVLGETRGRNAEGLG